jgi:4-hydroxybenzoate polyprenyltransferase
MTVVVRPPLRAWFDLARAGNFPSVWSNVLAALVLSAPADVWPPSSLWLAATGCATLAYAGGATLNDVFDADFDRRHRTDRAIPTGAVTRTAAARGGTLLLGAAVGLFVLALGASAVWAGSMAAAIVSYDWLHKRWAGSVILMAGCRAFLGLTVASIVAEPLPAAVLVWVSALSAYIIGVSLLARAEYRAGSSAAALGRWVGRLLAFMPLVDAAALAAVGAWPASLACAAAIPLGRAAQRVAAST